MSARQWIFSESSEAEAQKRQARKGTKRKPRRIRPAVLCPLLSCLSVTRIQTQPPRPICDVPVGGLLSPSSCPVLRLYPRPTSGQNRCRFDSRKFLESNAPFDGPTRYHPTPARPSGAGRRLERERETPARRGAGGRQRDAPSSREGQESALLTAEASAEGKAGLAAAVHPVSGSHTRKSPEAPDEDAGAGPRVSPDTADPAGTKMKPATGSPLVTNNHRQQAQAAREEKKPSAEGPRGPGVTEKDTDDPTTSPPTTGPPPLHRA